MKDARELRACLVQVEPTSGESGEERFYPEAQQALVADGVGRDVGDRMAVEAGQERIADHLVDQLEDVEVLVESAALDFQDRRAYEEVGLSQAVQQQDLGRRGSV